MQCGRARRGSCAGGAADGQGPQCWSLYLTAHVEQGQVEHERASSASTRHGASVRVASLRCTLTFEAEVEREVSRLMAAEQDKLAQLEAELREQHRKQVRVVVIVHNSHWMCCR